MAIQTLNGKETPSLKYNNFFLERLELTQRNETDDTAAPYFVLKVFYKMFAVDPANVRVFDTKVSIIEIKDYAAVAYAKAVAGDSDLVDAAVAIEHALAKIIIDQKPELGTATVTQ